MCEDENTRKRPNSTTPGEGVAKKPKSGPAKNDITELVKFLHMQKGGNQRMSEFYNQLKLQANKCDIKNPDTMVRDRLIQAITEEPVLEEVMRLRKPTAEKVYQTYQQMTLQKCMPNIQPLVEKLASYCVGLNGGVITIDGFVLKAYPVLGYPNFYLKFKDAPLVTLTRIAEGDIAGLMSCFAQIQHLTIRDMKILNSISGVPGTLKNLTMINVQIESEVFKQLLSNNKDTLEYLHLDNVVTCLDHANTSEGLYDFNGLCPNLSTLIVKSTSSNKRSVGRLEVMSDYFPFLIKRLPESLLYLMINQWSADWSNYNMVPSAIKRLKIYEPVNRKYEEDIKKTKIKSILVDFFDSPVEDVPDPNADSDPLEVNPDIPRDIPENLETWINSAPSFEKLTVKNVANDYLLWMLPHCTGLKKVTLFIKECTGNFKRGLSQQLARNINQMSNLTDLTVDSNIDYELLLQLLNRNKDTLTKFVFKVDEVEAWVRFQGIWGKVAEMENLTNFEIVKKYTEDETEEEEVEEGEEGEEEGKEEEEEKKELKRILSMIGKKLEILTMSGLSSCIDLLGQIQLPKLKNLKIDLDGHVDWTTLSSLTALQTLDLYYSEGCSLQDSDIIKIVKSFRNLYVLTLRIDDCKLSLKSVEVLQNYWIVPLGRARGHCLKFYKAGDDLQ